MSRPENEFKFGTQGIMEELQKGQTDLFLKKGKEYYKQSAKTSLESPKFDWNSMENQGKLLQKLIAALPQRPIDTDHELIEQLLKQSEIDNKNIEKLSEYTKVLEKQVESCYGLIGQLSDQLEKTRQQANQLEATNDGLIESLKKSQKINQELINQQANLSDILKEHVEIRNTFNGP